MNDDDKALRIRAEVAMSTRLRRMQWTHGNFVCPICHDGQVHVAMLSNPANGSQGHCSTPLCLDWDDRANAAQKVAAHG